MQILLKWCSDFYTTTCAADRRTGGGPDGDLSPAVGEAGWVAIAASPTGVPPLAREIPNPSGRGGSNRIESGLRSI